MIGDRLRSGASEVFATEVRSDVNDLVKVVMHRIQYGSPPLLGASDELGVSDVLVMQQKQKRIQRRRSLLGLPYQPWQGAPF